MKKLIRSTVPMLLLVSMLMGSLAVAHASEASLQYKEIASITSGLTISNVGKATCEGKAMMWDEGFTVTVTVELKQDGETIKTWTSTSSESTVIYAGGIYYVPHGHTYVVTTTVTVYDADGNVIESPAKDSPSKYY